MGLLEVLFGRTKKVKVDYDAMFRVPSAAVTLEASVGLVFSGRCGVCVQAVTSASFEQIWADVKATIGEGVSFWKDELACTWALVEDRDVGSAAAKCHTAASAVAEAGFPDKLLCAVFPFVARPDSESPTQINKAYFVYLFRRGSFYPFVPVGDEKRDSATELRLKAVIEEDLPIEQDLTRWAPLWGLPF